MIYLDNAATTFPKPQSVSVAINKAINSYGANPGRGGHNMAMKAAKEIYNCRVNIASLFNVEDETNVVFTLNCTHAINIVIKGLLKEGDHVVISNLEHNSVIRPIKELEKIGVTYSVATIYERDNNKTLNSFRMAFNSKTRLVVCTHASNVWGLKLPIERIGAMCKEYGILFLVDAAQSGGCEEIDMANINVDFLCLPGHKGLYGPMGTGILITKKSHLLKPLMHGGTGNNSLSYDQPEFMPDKFESGTLNLCGIAGLNEGVKFVKKVTQNEIRRKEMVLIQKLYNNLKNSNNVILYTDYPSIDYYVPILCFNVKDTDSEKVSAYLNKNYNIASRAGLHCSGLAHNAFGTENIGAVRASVSYFNSPKDIESLSYAISKFSI